MLGFHARAATTEVVCPDGELEDARFYTIQEVGTGSVLLPPATSISFQLIDDWFCSHTGLTLRAGQPWPAA
jgi:NAD+ diphosphatase